MNWLMTFGKVLCKSAQADFRLPIDSHSKDVRTYSITSTIAIYLLFVGAS